MDNAASAEHALATHEKGARLVGVAKRSGKLVEIRAVPSDTREGDLRLERLENGTVTNPNVFSGPGAVARSVLDAMADTYWMDGQAVAAAPAPIPVLPAPAVAHRGNSSAGLFALAASIVLVGGGGIGYLAWHDAAMRQPAPVAVASAAPAAAAPAPAPQSHESLQARRAVTPAPKVSLPGAAAPAPSREASAAAAGASTLPTISPVAEAPAAPAPAARPVKPAPAASAPQAAPRNAQAVSDGKAVAAAILAEAPGGAAASARLAPKPDAKAAEAKPADAKPADAKPAATAEAAKPDAATPVPGAPPASFVERSKAAAAEGATAASDARNEIAAIGAEKAQANLDVMQQVYEALNRSDKISPEMALQLPHDLAQKLREAGAILTPEEAELSKTVKGQQPTYKIVRLTPEAYDRLKDADGIPTVPQANSWAATGGNVRLPLPGGGDIKGPDDLRNDFHLEP